MRSFLYIIWLSICFIKPCLSSPAADLDDATIQEWEPVFRKDYTLDDEKRGWFKFHRIPEKWHDARLRCQLEGAELASPVDHKVYGAMLEVPPRFFKIFTGIHSLFNHGDYYSLKGVSVEVMPITWARSVSSDSDKRCVELWEDGTINNVKCDSELPYICYKNCDNVTLTECGTVDTEYKLNKELNTCYKLHTEKKTWENAFKTCSAEGGALMVIDSQAEFAAVTKLFNDDTVAEEIFQYKVFVGVVNWKQSGQWLTIYGKQLEKSGLFSKEQVENSGLTYGYKSCGALDWHGLLGVFCDEPTEFVCEKKPDSLTT